MTDNKTNPGGAFAGVSIEEDTEQWATPLSKRITGSRRTAEGSVGFASGRP